MTEKSGESINPTPEQAQAIAFLWLNHLERLELPRYRTNFTYVGLAEVKGGMIVNGQKLEHLRHNAHWLYTRDDESNYISASLIVFRMNDHAEIKVQREVYYGVITVKDFNGIAEIDTGSEKIIGAKGFKGIHERLMEELPHISAGLTIKKSIGLTWTDKEKKVNDPSYEIAVKMRNSGANYFWSSPDVP